MNIIVRKIHFLHHIHNKLIWIDQKIFLRSKKINFNYLILVKIYDKITERENKEGIL